MIDPIVIATARRTPNGRFQGALRKYTAVQLGTVAGRAAVLPIGSQVIDRVIVGQVYQAGSCGNTARQIGLVTGVSDTAPAHTVNMACCSGAQAFIAAVQAIRDGDSKAVLCGGTESMSNVPHLLRGHRTGCKLADDILEDGLIADGLRDHDGLMMGEKADRLAQRYDIDRKAQDAYALRSQHLTQRAAQAGHFQAEIVPLPELTVDEHPRPETTADALAKLKPVFSPKGTVTAGNASGINDGAAMMVLCRQSLATHHGWPRLAAVRAYATAAASPIWPGVVPAYAIRDLLKKTGIGEKDVHHLELNEAFAAQVLASMSQMTIDPTRLNPDGGSIALGHPVGCSGARVIVHLAHVIAAGRARLGIAAVAAAGGMSIAVMLEEAQDASPATRVPDREARQLLGL